MVIKARYETPLKVAELPQILYYIDFFLCVCETAVYGLVWEQMIKDFQKRFLIDFFKIDTSLEL